MTKKEAKYLARLEKRASDLRIRIDRRIVSDMSDAAAELKALEWAIQFITDVLEAFHPFSNDS